MTTRSAPSASAPGPSMAGPPHSGSPASPRSSGTDRQGVMLVALAGLILATMGVFVQEAGADPATTVAFRCTFGALAMLLWGAATGRLGALWLRGRALLGAVAAGGLMAASWGLHFAAIPRTSIGVSTVVFHVQPFWMMALGAWLLGEKVSLRQVLYAVMAFAGLVLTTGLFDGSGGVPSSRYGVGILLSLLGSLAFAGVTLLARVLKEVSSFALTWWQCLVGAVLTAWWPLLHGLPAHPAQWGWLVGLGVIHSGLAYALLYAGFARLSSGRTASLQFIYPMAAFVIDWQVYGHTLSAVQGVGLALMGGAIWQVSRSRG